MTLDPPQHPVNFQATSLANVPGAIPLVLLSGSIIGHILKGQGGR